MLAFSTCWNNSRHTDGEAMVDEILDLGFDTLELSHGMTITKLPGLQKAFREKKFRCLGIHNFFPSPTEVLIDAPDAFEFTSHRPRERQRALEMTLKTLDIAAEFEADYLVLHMGSVPLMPHKKWSARLAPMLKEGSTHADPEYAALKLKCVRKREKTGPAYLARAVRALEQIAERAKELGIRLAIESRSKYEDVPTPREMLQLQEHFQDNPRIGYWHDFGHVQLLHNLGFLDHIHWLDTIRPHLIGGHVHDVEWPDRDHRVPLASTIDFQAILSRFPVGCPLTWELSPTCKTGQIQLALQAWKQKFPGTFD